MAPLRLISDRRRGATQPHAASHRPSPSLIGQPTGIGFCRRLSAGRYLDAVSGRAGRGRGRHFGGQPTWKLVICLQWYIPPAGGAVAPALAALHAHPEKPLGPVVFSTPCRDLDLPCSCWTRMPSPPLPWSFGRGSDWVLRHARDPYRTPQLVRASAVVRTLLVHLGCPVRSVCDLSGSVLVCPCQLAVGLPSHRRHTSAFVATPRDTDGTARLISPCRFLAYLRRSSAAVRALTCNSWPGAPPAELVAALWRPWPARPSPCPPCRAPQPRRPRR